MSGVRHFVLITMQSFIPCRFWMCGIPQEFRRIKKMMTPLRLYGVNTFKHSSLIVTPGLQWMHFFSSSITRITLTPPLPSTTTSLLPPTSNFLFISSHQSDDNSSWWGHDVPAFPTLINGLFEAHPSAFPRLFPTPHGYLHSHWGTLSICTGHLE